MSQINATYHFRPVVAADLDLLETWRATPHVGRWWEDGPVVDAGDLDNPWVARRIVSVAGQEFAYMQDYDPHEEPGHHFGHLPPGSRGIDQFIGPAEMLGHGHGVAFIAQRMAALFAAGAPAIGVDPHPDNARAIHVYAKLGFQITGPAMQTPWGRALPMEIHVPRVLSA